MERLTKEQLENYINTYDRYEGIESNEFEKICNELIEYKLLEEELGIDLITLFNAEKVYYKYCEGSKYIYESIEVHFDLTNRVLRVYEYPEDEFGLAFQLSEYNRLWSLRKEDLENEN